MKKIIPLLIIMTSLFIPAFGEIYFTPTEWNLGILTSPSPLSTEVLIENTGEDAVTVQIMPTCDCVTVNPEELDIAPQSTGKVILFFDPKDETGTIDKFLLVRTTDPGLGKAHFPITGKIGYDTQSTGAPDSESTDNGLYGTSVEIVFYHDLSCKICEKFLEYSIPQLEKSLGTDIKVISKNLNDPAVYTELIDRLKKMNIEQKAFPVLIADGHALQGFDDICSNIQDALSGGLASQSNGTGFQEQEIAFLPALIAGLIDGINPCAFATIVALLSALTLAGRQKREILVMGIFYTAAVFLTYFLIGLGFFKIIREASVFPIVALILRWTIFAVLIVFAGLSVYDFIMIKKGNKEKMILQLNAIFKKRIQTTIKSHARSTAIVFSSIILGFLVSLFELGCTGQVYAPFITVYVLKIKQEFFGYFLLLLYNLAFILPLIIVFILVYFGLNSRKLANVLEKSMGWVKICLAVLFIFLAFLTVFYDIQFQPNVCSWM
ncbi:MAG: DUF1573 domain-containing protein [Spirochaetales bacterium]|nr:DUF1573 domain-containing protein [Spirochaetales bacterium]